MTTPQPKPAPSPTAAEDVRAAIERLKAAHAASTQGTWVDGQPGDGEKSSIVIIRPNYSLQWEAVIVDSMSSSTDAKSIAAIHNELPALFEAFARYRDHVGKLEAFFDRMNHSARAALITYNEQIERQNEKLRAFVEYLLDNTHGDKEWYVEVARKLLAELSGSETAEGEKK